MIIAHKVPKCTRILKEMIALDKIMRQGLEPMIGKTISHYKILERLGAVAWVSSTNPKT